MRVITGSAKGHRLLSLPGTDTMPTSESVKEAMMSTIQFEIEGARVLDLFAGTGQLGIEALSRGASFCQFVDKNQRCGLLIGDNLKHTNLKDFASITIADAVAWSKTTRGEFDIAFIDPPYESQLLPTLLPFVAGLMADTGVFLVETGRETVVPETAGHFEKQKDYFYGKKKFTSYRKGESHE